MTDNSSSKDLEWNIGKHRIQYLGEKTTEVRESFHKALKRTTRGRVENYLNSLETLYFDIRQYIEDEEVKEEIDEELESFREMDNPQESFKELKELDKKIQEKRLDLGLDIPSKTSPDSLLD